MTKNKIIEQYMKDYGLDERTILCLIKAGAGAYAAKALIDGKMDLCHDFTLLEQETGEIIDHME